MECLRTLRRFKNATAVEQSFFNPASLMYTHVAPGGHVQGPTFAFLERNPAFQETLEHVLYKDLLDLVKMEEDADLLRRLADVEIQTAKRKGVVQIIGSRIKRLTEEQGNGSIGNPDSRP